VIEVVELAFQAKEGIIFGAVVFDFHISMQAANYI
jgi:hypothetical protein